MSITSVRLLQATVTDPNAVLELAEQCSQVYEGKVDKNMLKWDYAKEHPDLSIVTCEGIDSWGEVLSAAAEFAGRCEGQRIGSGVTVGTEARVIIASGIELMIGSSPTAS